MSGYASEIIRRNIQFEYPATEQYSFYYEDNKVVTSLFVILSAMFPPGEMFFIESLRNVRSEIKDPGLLEDIKNFIAQEAFHSREHKSLNAHLAKLDYPEVYEIERATKEKLDQLRKLSPAEQLAATVVMEHYTATLARLLLTDPLIQTKTKQETRSLWEWHALEELEHKSVAFNALCAIGENTAKNRRKALSRVSKLLFPVLFQWWFKILKRENIKFSVADLKAGVFLGFGGLNRVGILTKAFVNMLDVGETDFDPKHMQTEQLEAEYKEKLFGRSGLLNQHLKH